jgi:hypothetical protein
MCPNVVSVSYSFPTITNPSVFLVDSAFFAVSAFTGVSMDVSIVISVFHKEFSMSRGFKDKKY